MKTLIKICLLLFALLTACKKDDSQPFYLLCKINGEKWEALKYESLLSNRHVLAARAYYDPDSAWLQVGGSRSVKTPSQPDSYMHGSMTINIIDFDGVGSYILTKYPGAGPSISYLLQSCVQVYDEKIQQIRLVQADWETK